MRRRLGAPGLVAVLLAVTPARGAVDAEVRVAFEHQARTGRGNPWGQGHEALAATGWLPVALRWARPLTQDERQRLGRLGYQAGSWLASGSQEARVRPEALDALESWGALARASLGGPGPAVWLPLDQGQRELGLDAGLAAAAASLGRPLTGHGVLIGDLDGLADAFHPAFFRAEEALAWQDADGDGRLTPGLDGLDLDDDGGLSYGEVLRLLDGRARNYQGTVAAIAGTDSPGLDPGHDYLYLDQDGDGRRGCGPAFGQALCEPTFVADDVDGDGALRPDERVRRLGASKVARVLHEGQVYRRGDNLGALALEVATAPAGLAHGTMVLGGLVGGQPGVSRFLGYAPGAEVVQASIFPQASSLASKASWLAEQGAQVLLAEVGYWGTSPSDGTSELELTLAALAAQGVLVVTPTGNLGASRKAASFTAAPGEDHGDVIERSSGAPASLWLSITWRPAEADLHGAVRLPGGEALELSSSVAAWSAPGGWSGAVARGATERGAGYALVALDRGGEPLPEALPLELRWSSNEPVTASLFVADDAGGWTSGLRLAHGTAAGSACAPSRAEGALAVGAYALHVGSPFSPQGGEAFGALRALSGRGPDLWGNALVGLVAPDNPVTAFPDASGMLAAYSEFGGTSGAGAAVAGLAALALEEQPARQGKALRQHLLATALRDQAMAASPESDRGQGKARFWYPPAPGTAPRLALEAPPEAPPGAHLTLTPTVDEGSLVRWDLGHDGSWDEGFQPPAPRPVVMPAAGPLDLKLEARAPSGWTRALTARIAPAPGAPAPQPTATAAPTASAPPGPPAAQPTPGSGGCGCTAAGPAGGLGWLAALAALASRAAPWRTTRRCRAPCCAR